MTKSLVIVESPAKAKTISKYLDNEYDVVASVGHIRDLPKSNKNAIDIENGFEPNYEVSPGKEKVVKDLCTRTKKAKEVILATDPDREGEAIAWHIAQACNLDNPKRIVFHEITKDAVQEAIQNPRDIDMHLKEAQEARRVLDRLFGYDLSGLIWKKVRYGLSAGRVQSPALRILVEREKEIRKFKPEAYWVIEALLKDTTNAEIPFTCSVEPKTEKEAQDIVTAAKKATWKVANVTESNASRNARAPFITSTLQQAASSRLNLSPSRTMRLAQGLYEAGHITYMRTDSINLSANAKAQIKAVVLDSFGKEYYQANSFKGKSKNAQEAHEAIRPSTIAVKSAGKNADEKKLYELIWARTVASQMAPAQMLKTKVTTATNDPAIPEFTANGNRITFEGWLKADPAARGEDTELPKLKAEDSLTLVNVESEGKETQPPHRYSEAGLVKELEKRGIGRPSTYASIIQTLQVRNYVDKLGRSLQPTEVGELVSDFINEHFTDYISDSFTAEMEDELDEIADGKRDYVGTLKEFYGPFTKKIAEKKDIEKITDLGPAPEGTTCPKCGGAMIIKLGKTGKFLSCAKFPDCDGALTMEGEELEGPKKTGEKCPECETGELIERDGRYGRFVACNNYPKCKYIKKDAEIDGEVPGDTGVECPICNKGTMVEKRGRYGVFYGCSNYPKCRHIIKTKPTGKICGYQREDGPCKHLMMEGTKTIPDRCSDKTCPNHNPHKLEKK